VVSIQNYKFYNQDENTKLLVNSCIFEKMELTVNIKDEKRISDFLEML